jgi:hypothetical protein
MNMPTLQALNEEARQMGHSLTVSLQYIKNQNQR